jgi:acyl-CoA synthetase (AMP-forming)/AMP-acid ligase II
MAGVIAHNRAIDSSANARVILIFMIVLLPPTTRNNDTTSSYNLSSPLTMAAVMVITDLRRGQATINPSHDYGIRVAIYASNMLEAPTSRESVALRGKRLEYFTIAWNSLEGLIALAAGILAGVAVVPVASPSDDLRQTRGGGSNNRAGRFKGEKL